MKKESTFFTDKICMLIKKSIPTKDSPYITTEMYFASKDSLYILAKNLVVYYSKKDIDVLNWVNYWLQDRIEECNIQITIFSNTFIPVCIALCAFLSQKSYPTILLLIYFFSIIIVILRSYLAKSYYVFHYDLVKKELKKRI